MGHIKKQRDPRVDLINILSARSAASRGFENQLILTNRNVLCYLNHRLFDSSISNADEIITEKIPLYFRKPGRGIRPGRNEIESVNRPIVCGGVLVEPGDVIIADGDGVIVVPRAKAKEVAEYAQAVIEGDKAGRRTLYKKLGLPPDDLVK